MLLQYITDKRKQCYKINYFWCVAQKKSKLQFDDKLKHQEKKHLKKVLKMRKEIKILNEL